MTVKELIKALKKLPKHTQIYHVYMDSEGETVSGITVEAGQIYLEGEHNDS